MANFEASTPQLKLIKKWIDAYSSLDMSNVDPLISRNFKFQTFPETIDLPQEGKGGYLQKFRGVLALVTNMKPIVHEVIEAPGRVVIHATGVFSLVDGTRCDYDTVCIISIVEEDGEIKILECKDFSDAQKRSAFYGGIARVAAEGALAL